jgi:hypothetical protein
VRTMPLADLLRSSKNLRVLESVLIPAQLSAMMGKQSEVRYGSGTSGRNGCND